MNRVILLVFSVLMMISGTDLAAQELKERYLFHDDIIREYLIYIPSTYNESEPAPLVFVLHGLGADKENMVGVRMNDMAEEFGYIVIYPDAILSFLGTAWNSGTILNTDIDDVGFITELIDTVSNTYNINDRRIYSCGFSMGGIMSHRLACEKSNLFAAIASQSGPLAKTVRDVCTPERPVPVLYIHGTADETLPYSGNVLYGTASAMNTFNRWGLNNDCGTDVEIYQVPDTANEDYHVERYTFTGCDPESEVIHYRIYDWPHRWPLFGYNINSTREMAHFFERHILPEADDIVLTPVIESIEEDLYSWGPNPFQHEFDIKLRPEFEGSWKIYSAGGQMVEQGNTSRTLNTELWQAGIYLLAVHKGNEVLTYKLIRQ